MTVVEHLSELRNRLVISVLAIIIGTAVAWPLYGPVFRLLSDPFCKFMSANPRFALDPAHPCKLVYTSIVEPFMVKLKLVVFMGIVLALPVVLYQFWRFVTPGLTSREKKYALPFVFSAILLFALGGWFALITLPKGLQFLLGFAGTTRVAAVLSIGKYIGFVMVLVLAFGGSFEFPVVLVGLELAGVVSTRWLRARRRYAILIIALFAAVVTPSQDWFTMTAMMAPLILFYEVSILIGRLMKR